MDVGRVIEDRYEIEGQAGSTDAVELYDALDRGLNRPVTLQVLRQDLAADIDKVKGFEVQQGLALTLFNCSVLAVYDLGVLDGRPFSVMERFKPLLLDERRDGELPDIEKALRCTRQAAEGVDCCRESGLANWVFSPASVGVDGEGNARVGIIEARNCGGQTENKDVEALAALLRGLLGDEGVMPLPVGVKALLEKAEGSATPKIADAGEFAAAIADLEAASNEATEAHSLEAAPLIADSAGVSPQDPTLPMAVAVAMEHRPAVESGKMATRELRVLAAERDIAPQATHQLIGDRVGRQSHGLPPVMLLGGLVALALMFLLVLPRFIEAQAARSGVEGVAATPSVAALVQVPDLRGKSLDEAQVLAKGFRFEVVLGAPGNDPALPPNTVVTQEPVAGVSLPSGSVITVGLNSIEQAQPPAPPAVQPSSQQAPQPAAKGEQGKKNDENKGKAKGKDK